MIMPKQIVLNALKLGPSSTNAANGGIIDLLPWTDFSAFKELTFYIVVSAINGVPTGGSLKAKFQLGSPHVTSQNQFSSISLADLDTAQKGSLIVEGDWPNPICTYNQTVGGSAISATNALTVKRTIKDFGTICNLQLDASSLTGGTTPTFTVTVVMEGK